jgi:hypothetical protein
VHLDVTDSPMGELHAIIGPKGVGKSTLTCQRAVEISPGAEEAHGRRAPGLARSFQITSLFLDFTVPGNVALVIQAHAGYSFRFWRPACSEARKTPVSFADDLLPLGERGILGIFAPGIDPRIVDQQIDAAESVENAGAERGDAFLFRNVRGEGLRRSSRRRNRPPDASGAAGHNHNLVFE